MRVGYFLKISITTWISVVHFSHAEHVVNGWMHANWQTPASCLGHNTSAQSHLGRHSRVIGGRVSTRGDWPWLAALGLQSEGQECGASLIAEDWIVTAAHCIQQRSLDPCDYNIRLGEHHLRDSSEEHVDIIPDQIILHPKYRPQNFINDIALLHLSQPAPIASHPEIEPIALPNDDLRGQDIERCQVAGWGRYDVNSLRTSDEVRHVPAPILTRSTCFRIFGLLPRGQICAGRLLGGQDSCQGDSGGPLVCEVKGHWVQLGLVSWGRGCADVLLAGVYTSLAHYKHWIESVIKK